MKIRRRILVLAAVITVMAFAAWAPLFADERTPKALPGWVTKLVSKHFPDAELLRGHREGDEDEQRYEVKLRQRDNGRDVSLDVTQQEGVVEIDEQLNREQVPERVMKALRRTFPKAELKEAERNTDMRISYTLVVTSEGRKREVTISPRGKILEIERRD